MALVSPRLRPPFPVYPELTTARLWLRELTPADLPQILDISYFQRKKAESVEEATEMLTKIGAEYARGEAIHWGIVLRETGEVVGSIGFYRGFPRRVGEVGYILRAPFRGRGLAREAAAAVARFGLEVLQLRRVVAFVDPGNQPSINVVLGSGFRLLPTRGADGDLCFALDAPGGRKAVSGSV